VPKLDEYKEANQFRGGKREREQAGKEGSKAQQ